MMVHNFRMDPFQLQAITIMSSELAKKMTNGEVFTYSRINLILTQYEEEYLKGLGTRFDRNVHYLDTIKNRNSFEIFLSILEETNQKHLSDRIRSAHADLRRGVLRRVGDWGQMGGIGASGDGGGNDDVRREADEREQAAGDEVGHTAQRGVQQRAPSQPRRGGAAHAHHPGEETMAAPRVEQFDAMDDTSGGRGGMGGTDVFNRGYTVFSVGDKRGLEKLARFLHDAGLQLAAYGSTAVALREKKLAVKFITDFIANEEIVKGIRYHNTMADRAQSLEDNFPMVQVVVFDEDFSKTTTDMTGSSIGISKQLVQAAADNHDRVIVLCDPDDYLTVAQQLASGSGDTTPDLREKLAEKALHYSNTGERIDLKLVKLRPRAVLQSGGMPFTVLNGTPSYTNVLDAWNAWRLAKELQDATELPAVASFKHGMPTGAAIGVPLDDVEAEACMADQSLGVEIQSLAAACVRQGADQMSSFGDFIALSDKCDDSVATIISTGLSVGVVAPDFDHGASQILFNLMNGHYIVIKVDPLCAPMKTEEDTIFGLNIKPKQVQNATIKESRFETVVTRQQADAKLPQLVIHDLVVATTTLKYTESNSVCFAHRGQIIGIGVGLDSRIGVRLARRNAGNWWLKQNQKVLALPFKKSVKRAERLNAIDLYVTGDVGHNVIMNSWLTKFEKPVDLLTEKEKNDWFAKMKDVVLSSNAPFNCPDIIDHAKQYGVKYIASPEGSTKEVIDACNDRDIVLIHTGVQLFHH